MNISSTLMLAIGIAAFTLFVAVFVVTALITRRNRRVVRRYAEKSSGQ